MKPPANHLQTTWHKAAMPIVLMASLFAGMASASVPLAWQVTPRNPAPVSFDRHHGETLEFRCTFTGFGELPFSGSGAVTPRLYYQTNGMAAAWWSVPASVSSNVLSATFPPSVDPGADRLALFFGAPSNAYASAVLRLRHSPGFAPNILPPPEQATFEETDPVFAAWLAATELVHEEQDPTVPAWAKSPTPPSSGLTTNDVCNIVMNEVGVWSLDLSMFEYADELYTSFSVRYFPSLLKWGLTIENEMGEVFADTPDPDDAIGGEGVAASADATRLEFSNVRNLVGDPVGGKIIANLSQSNALRLARLSDLPPLTNAIPDTAARAVYDVHDLMWDETESILYWHKIRQGHDEYIAVTNIDLTHPTNAVILKAWREANR